MNVEIYYLSLRVLRMYILCIKVKCFLVFCLSQLKLEYTGVRIQVGLVRGNPVSYYTIQQYTM